VHFIFGFFVLTRMFLSLALLVAAAGVWGQDSLLSLFVQSIPLNADKETSKKSLDTQTKSPTASKNELVSEDKIFSSLREALEADSFEDYLLHINWRYLLIKILKIIIIISTSIFLWKTLNKAIQHYLKRLPLFKKKHASKADTVALFKTITPIIKSFFHWALIILTILIVLSELNVNIIPIIFSFSVIGLAFSIGSQTLVKDLINGILTLFEGNIAVGDVVTIGKYTGTVESMSLRSISLRHFTGELQTISFSEVTSLINLSRDFSIASIVFVVSAKASLADVKDALDETFLTLKADTHFGSFIQGPMGAFGIKKIAETGIHMSTTVPIIPDPKKTFSAEFNKNLYANLHKRNVPLCDTSILVNVH
jgi:small-conductance mechanosensitive channel